MGLLIVSMRVIGGIVTPRMACLSGERRRARVYAPFSRPDCAPEHGPFRLSVRGPDGAKAFVAALLGDRA